MAFPEISAASRRRTTRPGIVRRARSPHGVNCDSQTDRDFQTAADECRLPAPSQRQPENGNQECGNRNDQKCSIHMAAFLAGRLRSTPYPSCFYGRYVAAVRSDSHTVMLETAAPLAVACICCAVCS